MIQTKYHRIDECYKIAFYLCFRTPEKKKMVVVSIVFVMWYLVGESFAIAGAGNSVINVNDKITTPKPTLPGQRPKVVS